VSEDLKPHRYEPIALSSKHGGGGIYVPEPYRTRAGLPERGGTGARLYSSCSHRPMTICPLTSEAAIWSLNLRAQLEALNNSPFPMPSGKRFFSSIANPNHEHGGKNRYAFRKITSVAQTR
jgi:type I restriction enzyme, R subunit